MYGYFPAPGADHVKRELLLLGENFIKRSIGIFSRAAIESIFCQVQMLFASLLI